MRLRSDPQALIKCKKSNYFTDLKTDSQVVIEQLFNNKNKLFHLEIGSGKGIFLWKKALENPTINFLGLEKYPTVVKKALTKYEKSEIKPTNLLLMIGDACNLLSYFQNQTFEKIYLNFSDPWPKTRHASRRLVDISFLKMYETILKPEGLIEFKTDNDQLNAYCLKQLKLKQNIVILHQTNDLHNLPNSDPLLVDNIMTEYENNFVKINKNIHKLIFKFQH